MQANQHKARHSPRFPAASLTRSALLLTISLAIGGVGMTTALAVTPREQKAIVQVGNGGPEVLGLQTVPVLAPGANQVLIKVYAAAINPVDWKYRIGMGDYAPRSPKNIPGGDVAGVIETLGSGVTGFKVGDPVFAIVPRVAGMLNGAYSQFAVAPTSTVVAKPSNVTYAEAAGLGIAAVTGVRSVAVTKVAKGQRVLITGVAGGVGSAAAQAAKAKGAYVIGTASARHTEYLRSIGVDEVIDYTKGKFETQVHDVDVVIDTVGSDTAERAFATIKKGGMYVSVAARNIEGKCAAAGVTCAPRGNATEVGRSIFDEVASLAAAGKLNVHIDKTFPLEQAAQAQTYSEQGRTQGKIGLIVDAERASTK